MGYDENDIALLRKKAENKEKVYINKRYKYTFDKNIDSADEKMCGFAMRSVVCLCLFAAFIIAAFNQEGEIFTSKIEEKISENQILKEVGQGLENIKEVFLDMADKR